MKVPAVLSTPTPDRRPLLGKRTRGHLLATKTGTQGWWQLGEAHWQFRSVEEQEGLLSKIGPALAGLAGRDLILRGTTRPVNAEAIVHDYDVSIPDPPDMDEWQAHLTRYRDRIADARPNCAPGGLVETSIYVGVSLGKGVNVADGAASEKVEKAWRKVADAEAQVGQLLDGRGLYARPVDSLGWLLHRSAAPGIEPPSILSGDWTPRDFDILGETVRKTCRPFGRTVEIAAIRDGQTVRRYAVVLSVGKMEDRWFPEDGSAPWLAFASRMPFPVEWVASGKVVAGRALVDKFDQKRRYAADSIKHSEEHDEMAPEDAIEAQHRAAELHHEAKTGARALTARWHGVVRLVVTGATEDEAVSNARALQQAYLEDESIELVQPWDQVAAIRELIPGEKWATDSFQRHMKVSYLAAGVPNVTGELGNGTGMYLGYTVGDAPGRVVLHNRHTPMEQLNKSGMRLVIAQPGSGKSALGVRLLDDAGQCGEAVLAFDPPGEMAAITRMPRHRGHSLHLDLAAARPGTFETRRLIPMPDRDDFDTDDEYQAEKARVPELRAALFVDSLLMNLPETMKRRDGTEELIGDAVAQADSDPWGTLGVLRDMSMRVNSLGQRVEDEHIARIFRTLERAAHGYARILFPEPGRPLDEDGLEDVGMVVMTMNGMSLPDPHSDPTQWGIPERASVMTTHLAAHYVRRFIHIRPRSERKVVLFDEFYWLADWKDGPTVARTTSRDSRRRNTAAYFLSQHGGDPRKLDPSGDVFTSGGFLGRQEKLSSAQASLQVFDIPTDVGYEEDLRELGPGQFLHVDDEGRAGLVQVDFAHDPELFEAANTTPDGRRP